MFWGSAIGKAAQHYLGTMAATHPLASPLYADLKGLPPLFVQASTIEVLLDDSVRARREGAARRAATCCSRPGPTCRMSGICSIRTCPRRAPRSARPALSSCRALPEAGPLAATRLRPVPWPHERQRQKDRAGLFGGLDTSVILRWLQETYQRGSRDLHRRSRPGRGTRPGAREGQAVGREGDLHRRSARDLRERLRLPDVPRQRALRGTVSARHRRSRGR